MATDLAAHTESVEDSLARLAAHQRACREVLAPLDDDLCRLQPHPDLSPLSWHLGHCVFVETYWLRERLLGDDTATADLHSLYFPENIDKALRSDRLPHRRYLLDWARRTQAENLDILDRALRERDDPMTRRGYLPGFIGQHYCQHLETMQMVLRQLRLHETRPGPAAEPHAPGTSASPETVRLPGGPVTVGTTDEVAAPYDNERPRWTTTLEPFALARRPVTNAEFLAFMADGGYRRPSLWDQTGWRHCRAGGWRYPQHWRRDGERGWVVVGPEGAAPLDPAHPVEGISWYEADAFARWAGARLPHEHEWEAACRAGVLEDVHRVWEWCANSFFAYPGFRPYPYHGYSVPWFDGAHFTLRGSSRYSRPDIRRPGFRNFYPPQTRHLFAGLRLAW